MNGCELRTVSLTSFHLQNCFITNSSSTADEQKEKRSSPGSISMFSMMPPPNLVSTQPALNMAAQSSPEVTATQSSNKVIVAGGAVVSPSHDPHTSLPEDFGESPTPPSPLLSPIPNLPTNPNPGEVPSNRSVPTPATTPIFPPLLIAVNASSNPKRRSQVSIPGRHGILCKVSRLHRPSPQL